MKRRHKQSGFTLIEMLIAGLIATILAAGLWTLIRTTYDSQYEMLGQNTANTQARIAVDELADKLRGAKVLTAATASSVTFTDNSSNSYCYWVDGGKLLRSINGAPTTGTTVARDVQSAAFVYWSNASGGWISTSAPATPSDVNAVDFSVLAGMNGCSRQISGSVRVRQK